MKKIRNNIFFIYIAYLFYSIFSRLRLILNIEKKNILEKKDFCSVQNKPCCFILGSGASVNDLKYEQFKIIEENFSIGINSWFLHDFISDIYMYEAGDPAWSNAHEIFNYIEDNLNIYEKKPILIPFDSFWFDKEIKHLRTQNKLKIYYYFVLPFFFTKLRLLRKSIKIKSIIARFLGLDDCIYGSGSSIIRSVFLAEELGFEKIVLVGVDLNNSAYFYEDDEKFMKQKNITQYKSNQIGDVHITNDPEKKNIILEDFLKEIDKDINFKPKILVASQKSSLYPMLELYDWRNCN